MKTKLKPKKCVRRVKAIAVLPMRYLLASEEGLTDYQLFLLLKTIN
jgi:hypothetical protein